MRQEIARAQRLVARIAARQHGVISQAQLVGAGMSPSTITRRLCEGWLQRVHRGVYALGGGNLSREGRWLAAVLACGEGAVLSHRSAAALWSISPANPRGVDITVPAAGGRSKRPGITIHRSITLTRGEVTRRWNIPVTTHARTLRDLGYGPEPTRSTLERGFLRLCREHGIPAPEVNVKVGPYRVDFLWRAERLIVEADSWTFHSGRGSFEADRARDVELDRRGFNVLRFTYRQVMREPERVAAALLLRLRT